MKRCRLLVPSDLREKEPPLRSRRLEGLGLVEERTEGAHLRRATRESVRKHLVEVRGSAVCSEIGDPHRNLRKAAWAIVARTQFEELVGTDVVRRAEEREQVLGMACQIRKLSVARHPPGQDRRNCLRRVVVDRCRIPVPRSRLPESREIGVSRSVDRAVRPHQRADRKLVEYDHDDRWAIRDFDVRHRRVPSRHGSSNREGDGT